MIYFFSMQCPDCGYISFKQEKNCGSCGFNLKKAVTSPASLFRNDSFTIFSNPNTSEKEQESFGASAPQAGEGIAVIDPPESSQEKPELKSGEFLVDLSATKKEEPKTTLKSDASDPDTFGFGTGADINLEEMEVEGLGLGLEPFEEDPVLDLGNTEIISDLDEDLKPESPEPSPAPAQSDELEIKLEIDDSDGPLTINDDEIPEVEIEDLGLELEDPDSPSDPEKP